MPETKTTITFKGPLFIVGTARSGSQLLRGLLNQNPSISLPLDESHFIPYLAKAFDIPRSDPRKLMGRFLKELKQTAYFQNFERKGFKLDCRRLFTLDAWPNVFELIFRSYTPLHHQGDHFIWGDKTPKYLKHLPLLKSIFPKAKFIHIIRDPRDGGLSAQKAWKRNIYQYVSDWNRNVRMCRNAGNTIKDDYLEVFYEKLLEDPQSTLKEVCAFLECEFSPDMLRLKTPADFIEGNTSGQTAIIKNNTNDHLKVFSIKTLRRLEEIGYPLLVELNYPVHYAIKHRPLLPVTLAMLKLVSFLRQAACQSKSKDTYGRFSTFLLTACKESLFRASPLDPQDDQSRQ